MTIVDFSSDLICFAQVLAASLGLGFVANASFALFQARSRRVTPNSIETLQQARSVSTAAIGASWVTLLASALLTKESFSVLLALFLTTLFLSLNVGLLGQRTEEVLATDADAAPESLSPERVRLAVAGTAGPLAGWLLALALQTVTLLSAVPALPLLGIIASLYLAFVAGMCVIAIPNPQDTRKFEEPRWTPPIATGKDLLAAIVDAAPAHPEPRKVQIPLVPLGSKRPTTIVTKPSLKT